MLESEFYQKLVLLVATAVISGFLVPFILKQVEEKRSIEQRRREARIARQKTLIDAQSELLESISLAIWKWRYAFMRVTYYGGQDSQEQCDTSWQSYCDNVWELLNNIRYQVSRSKWLVSDRQFEKLLDFYCLIIKLDKRLFSIRSMSDPVTRAMELSDLNYQIYSEISASIDELISHLANELKLSAEAQIDKM